MFNQPATHQSILLESVEALRQALGELFVVSDTTLDWPRPGQVRFRGQFTKDPAICYDELRSRFERHGFTPLLRPDQHSQNVAIIALPTVFNPPPSNWVINLILFILTIFSTLYFGAAGEPGFTGTQFWLGWKFSLCLLLILGSHELGHYFAARYHKVPVTLPYFIPFPTIFGTMGAFIQLKAPVKNRRALLDIGVAGPLAGMVFALPILFIGLATSSIAPLPAGGYILEGNSFLYALAKMITFGHMLPAGGQDVTLNQVAWAGWVGLFVTGLNLIPLGQLDGGHVAYVLFGQQARHFYWPILAGMVILSLMSGSGTWGLFIVLLFFFGRTYAETLDEVTVLDGRRRAIAIFALILFVLVFVPTPLQIF